MDENTSLKILYYIQEIKNNLDILEKTITPIIYPDNLQYQDPPGTFEGIPDSCDG